MEHRERKERLNMGQDSRLRSITSAPRVVWSSTDISKLQRLMSDGGRRGGLEMMGRWGRD